MNKVQCSVNYGKSSGLLRLITDGPPVLILLTTGSMQNIAVCVVKEFEKLLLLYLNV